MKGEGWSQAIFVICLTLVAIVILVIAWRYAMSLVPVFEPVQLPTLRGQ